MKISVIIFINFKLIFFFKVVDEVAEEDREQLVLDEQPDEQQVCV